MVLLQKMKHRNIVRFHDWFESKVGLNSCLIVGEEWYLLTMPVSG